MNKERRKAIEDAKEQLGALRDTIEGLCDEEQDYFDNMPGSFQQGEKGDAAQTAVDALYEAVNLIDEALSFLDESISN